MPKNLSEFSNKLKGLEDISDIHVKNSIWNKKLDVKLEKKKIPASFKDKEYENKVHTNSTDLDIKTTSNGINNFIVDEDKIN